jgi:hypothetical protein
MLLHQLIPAVVTLAKRFDSVLLGLPGFIRRMVLRAVGGSDLQET